MHANLQEHISCLEQSLAQCNAELATSRSLEGRLQQRLVGCVLAEEHARLNQRLQAAEEAAATANGALSALTLRAEEAEHKLANAAGMRQHALADATHLRCVWAEQSPPRSRWWHSVQTPPAQLHHTSLWCIANCTTL
jgi:hypothetical protein